MGASPEYHIVSIYIVLSLQGLGVGLYAVVAGTGHGHGHLSVQETFLLVCLVSIQLLVVTRHTY